MLFMSHWYKVWLRFKTPLNEEQISKVRVALKQLDHDAPVDKLSKEGLNGVSWRSPMYDIEEFAGLLHLAGMESEFDYHPESYYFEREYIPKFIGSEPIRKFGNTLSKISLTEAAEVLSSFGDFGFVLIED